MDIVTKAALMYTAFELLIKRSQLDDNERVSIAEFHEAWQQKAYGGNEYVQYGETASGRAQLYRSTRNVASNAPPPDVATNPQNWVKVG